MDDPIRRARTHEAAGEIDAALAAYREAAAAPEAPTEARIRIVGILLMRGALADAEQEARAFVAARADAPEAHATLGQVLRLSFRHDDAIASFAAAARLASGHAGYRMLLNDARRARYWAPDDDVARALTLHVASDRAGESARMRLFHLRFAGLLNPEIQRWIAAREGDSELPAALRESLDARFEGRFSRELAAVEADRSRVEGPSHARVTLADGSTREGSLADADATIGSNLEVIEQDDYRLVPFGEIASAEFAKPSGSYVGATLTSPDGSRRQAEVPALYVFTEGSRLPEAREGRRTVWRAFAPGLAVGVGLRRFRLDATTIGIDQVRRIEFPIV